MNQLQEQAPRESPRAPGQRRGGRVRQSKQSNTFKALRNWFHIHLRRWAYLLHGAAAGVRAVGPVSFLGVSAALGMALTVTILYSTSYAVIVDGQELGIVLDQDQVNQVIRSVEKEGSALLGYTYQVDSDIDYQFTLTLKSDLTDGREIETFFYDQLNELSAHLRKYELLVDGRTIGVVQNEQELARMLDSLKARYINENTVSADFVEKVSVDYVYSSKNLMTVDQVAEILTASAVGETTYSVVKGDTFNAIAYANDMSVSDLKALNPDVNVNRLSIGQVLNVKEMIPFLSIQTAEHQVYLQQLDCPVETVDDSSMYKGDSKILTQGVPGEALVEANVTYVNGYERDREILSSTTLQEPTTTVKAVGTKEKPKTASKGYFNWPISGRITSYFGGRTLFGSYNYHSGLDIAASYGASIKAADGGTVTFAGSKGTYGNLVIITHDNGMQTYYAHNSSLVVRAGEKVYQGQTIAKAGKTGRATGVHCHFEVRVNGKAVNPLNYLR